MDHEARRVSAPCRRKDTSRGLRPEPEDGVAARLRRLPDLAADLGCVGVEPRNDLGRPFFDGIAPDRARRDGARTRPAPSRAERGLPLQRLERRSPRRRRRPDRGGRRRWRRDHQPDSAGRPPRSRRDARAAALRAVVVRDRADARRHQCGRPPRADRVRQLLDEVPARGRRGDREPGPRRPLRHRARHLPACTGEGRGLPRPAHPHGPHLRRLRRRRRSDGRAGRRARPGRRERPDRHARPDASPDRRGLSRALLLRMHRPERSGVRRSQSGDRRVDRLPPSKPFEHWQCGRRTRDRLPLQQPWRKP